MSWATSEVVTVLAFLLPGLVSVIVFYALTSHPKPSELERIVQALAFTIASQVISSVAVHIFDFDQTADEWPEFSVVVLPFCISVILALIAATATNHDFPHSLLRKIGITRETSYSSEWYGAFAENEGQYVVLHLKNGNRLLGWPEEWPGKPNQGHFRMSDCEWLVEADKEPHPKMWVLLVPAQDVNMVEFIKTEEPQE